MATTASRPLSDDVVRWFSDPQARSDPYEFFDRLRSEDPVHYSEQLGFWVLTRYDDGDHVFRGAPVVRSPAGADMEYMHDEHGELRPTWRLDRGTHRWHDGEELARIRRLVSSVMGARQIRTWRGDMQVILDQEVQRLGHQGGRADLIADFVFELPMQMICRVFGIPPSATGDLRRWTEDWFAAVQVVTDPEVQARGDDAALGFEGLVGELIEFKQANPDDGMLSLLIRARDDEDRLSDEELVAMTASMLGAGHETTGSQAGNTMLALLGDHDQLRAVRDDPSLTVAAVEEGFRYEPAAMLTPRYATEDFELGDKTIHAGDAIMIIIQASGRSPDSFADPHRYWIGRPDKKHLAFALGPHFCCGAQLARIELELMVGAIATSFPRIELETETVTWKPGLGIRGLTALPVAWN